MSARRRAGRKSRPSVEAVLFAGDQDGCKAFCRGRATGWYVYVLRRPDGRPFYVGKGTGDRVAHHENEARHPNDRRSNAHKLNVIRAIWRRNERVGYEINGWFDGEQAAYDHEAALIGRWRRLHEGGLLTNRAPGGGVTGAPSPFSRARHEATLGGIPDDNPERAVLNRFVLSIAAMRSVVLKPLGQFQPKPTRAYPSKSMMLTLRQAAALVASAAANGIRLDVDAELPRTVWVDGVAGFIENGVSCDLVTSRTVGLRPATAPADERFNLSQAAARRVVGLVGIQRCRDLGVI